MKLAVITGTTSGIGKAAALSLAKGGVNVVAVSRDRGKGEAVVAELKRLAGAPNVELLVCDMSARSSIRAAVEEFKQRHESVNILVNCAAMFSPKRIITSDGLELMFATNYLGPFLLTNLLLDRLEAGAPARIINVTAPSTVKPDFDDLQGERSFNAARLFGASKAAELLFTYALAEKLRGKNVTVNAFHPGVVRGTNLMKQAPTPMRVVSSMLNAFVSISPEQAGESLVDLATNERFAAVTGQLIYQSQPMKAPFQGDQEAQARLWTESLKLVGLSQEQ